MVLNAELSLALTGADRRLGRAAAGEAGIGDTLRFTQIATESL